MSGHHKWPPPHKDMGGILIEALEEAINIKHLVIAPARKVTMSDNVDRRFIPLDMAELAVEMRGESSPTLKGNGVVFNTLSENLGGFREQIAPNAFRAALEKSDVRGLFNHNPDHLLARSSAGTLRLVKGRGALRYEMDLDGDQLSQFVRRKVERRELTGSSFSFTIADGGDEWDERDDVLIRTVTKIDALYDIGPVTFPAYTETTVSARSLDMAKSFAFEALEHMEAYRQAQVSLYNEALRREAAYLRG